MILDIFYHWNRRQIPRTRAAVIFGALTPIALIALGVIFGMMDWYLKFVVCELATIVATICLWQLITDRAVFAAEISAVVGIAQWRVKSASETAEEIVRFVAGIITSVIVVGTVLVWPDYTTFRLLKLMMTVLLVISAVAVITHVIWKGGGKWWHRLAWWVIVGNVLLAVMALSLPRSFEVITSIPSRIDKGIACWDNPSAKGCPRPAPAVSAAVTPKTFTWEKIVEVEAPRERWGPEFPAPMSRTGILRWIPKDGEAEVRCSNGFYVVLGVNTQRDESGQAAGGKCWARSSDKPTMVAVYTPQV